MGNRNETGGHQTSTSPIRFLLWAVSTLSAISILIDYRGCHFDSGWNFGLDAVLPRESDDWERARRSPRVGVIITDSAWVSGTYVW